MPPFTWYVRRAQAMTPDELLWRARAAVRDAGDRVRIPLGLVPSRLPAAEARGRFPLVDVAPGAWRSARDRDARWRDRLVERADRLLAHRASFFEVEDCDLGSPIRWNYDYARGRATPMAMASTIDYRDCSVAGDCKVVWEPSRHHQLVVLARAYRATGDLRYAREVVAQIESWIDQCPFGRGMQWRSPLELAIRAINWTWADHLLDGAAVFGAGTRARFLAALRLHVWDIGRKLSRGSSANNHLIGEAAGLFIVACCYPGLAGADRWRRTGAAILEREVIAQTYADGGSREQAFGYHAFVLQFLLVAAVIGRRAGVPLSARYWSRLERMLEFASAMVEAGPPPMFGDADDGYVLDLGGGGADVRDQLAVAAALFGRSDFKRAAGGHAEPVRWLLGASALARYDSLEAAPQPLASRAFPDSGYYLLQTAAGDVAAPISVLFDCGELGLGALAAHGHADALSLSVRACGDDLLVDPGTFDYFAYPEWRRYFRSTRAHNTVEVDGEDQSEMLGPFQWGRRAAARCTEWRADDRGIAVAGEHDGYARLADPVVHRRRVFLDPSGVLTVSDELIAAGAHRVALHFHAAEGCTVEPIGANRFTLATPRAVATLAIDPALAVQASRGSAAPPAGWVSRRYHRKAPATTLAATGRIAGPARFVCSLEVKRRNG